MIPFIQEINKMSYYFATLAQSEYCGTLFNRVQGILKVKIFKESFY